MKVACLHRWFYIHAYKIKIFMERKIFYDEKANQKNFSICTSV